MARSARWRAAHFLAAKGISVRRACLPAQLQRAAFHYQARSRPDINHYNEERPHSALGYQTLSEFKRAWVAAQQSRVEPHRPFILWQL